MQFGSSTSHFNTLHEELNIVFGGGVDDIWENVATGELHIVDYKSTSQQRAEPKPLDRSFIAPPIDPKEKDYKAGYRRQMDMYQWILRRMGFEVSDVGYFVYVDGLHHDQEGMIDLSDPSIGWMKFDVAIIPYEGNDSWVEDALHGAKECLLAPSCPAHSSQCEFGSFLDAVRDIS
jgi:hypothetical protein